MAAPTLEDLRKIFKKYDYGYKGRLNRKEFKLYVEMGYDKTPPDNMYDHVCMLYKENPKLGISWENLTKLWQESQPTKSPPPPSKSPPPKSKSAEPYSSHPAWPLIKALQVAFSKADKNLDGYLTEYEFNEFVKHGFSKVAPNGMYGQVCSLFGQDPKTGLDWDSAFRLWKQSNPQYQNPPNPGPPKPNNNQTYKSNGKKGLSAPYKMTASKSTGNLNESNHQKKNSTSIKSDLTDTDNLKLTNNDSAFRDDLSESSELPVHTRVYSNMRRQKTLQDIAKMQEEDDASTLMVQILEKKLKDKTAAYKVEKAKRQRLEEHAQKLLIENEKFKDKIAELQQENVKLTKDLSSIKEQSRKLVTQVEDDSKTINHLQSQRDAMKNERDESFKILTKIEKDHQSKLRKLREQHKNEMGKLSQGFLQSLGAEPGKDVRTVINDLVHVKEDNVKLTEQIETLAQTLARKEKSLIEALSAVDQLVVDDEKYEQAQLNAYLNANNINADNKNEKKSNRLKFGKNSDNGKPKSPLPAPPPNKKSNKKKDGKNNLWASKPNASFFKDATQNTKNKYPISFQMGPVQKTMGMINNNSNKKSDVQNKEIQFVNQQLTSELNDQAEQIESLKIANKALLDQASNNYNKGNNQDLP